jgi:hypothetical protein
LIKISHRAFAECKQDNSQERGCGWQFKLGPIELGRVELRNIEPNGFHQFYSIAGCDHTGAETIVKGEPVIFKAFLEMGVAYMLRENLFQRSEGKVVGCDKADSAVSKQRAQHPFRAYPPIMRVCALQNFIEQE